VAVVPETALSTTGGINPLGLQAGDTLTLRDLLFACLLASDNVAAVTLADHLGRSLPNPTGLDPVGNTVAHMNALARQLGMRRTLFLNPHGLDAPEGQARPDSTAADLARLLRYGYSKPGLTFYVSQPSREIHVQRGGSSLSLPLSNTNRLLGNEGIDGGKTGRTSQAGECIILTAQKTPEVRREGIPSSPRPVGSSSSSWIEQPRGRGTLAGPPWLGPLSGLGGARSARQGLQLALTDGRLPPEEDRRPDKRRRLPGLNAVLRGIFCASDELGWEVLGFRDGFEGMLPDGGDYLRLTRENTQGIMQIGGTILGTTNKGHFTAKVAGGERAAISEEVIARASRTCRDLDLSAIIAIGGDGSLSTALQLYRAGFPMIGVPKTIDNDLEATAMTFGFDSAVACVTDALDRLHTTAASHKRVIVVQVMGRHAGWIALWGGLAGAADMILIPEIPLARACRRDDPGQDAAGFKSTMIVVAEERGHDTASSSANSQPAASGGSAALARCFARKSSHAPARTHASASSATCSAG